MEKNYEAIAELRELAIKFQQQAYLRIEEAYEYAEEHNDDSAAIHVPVFLAKKEIAVAWKEASLIALEYADELNQ